MSLPELVEFEDELYRRQYDGEPLRSLVKETQLEPAVVRALVERAADRDTSRLALADGYQRPRRRRRQTEIVESFEEARAPQDDG